MARRTGRTNQGSNIWQCHSTHCAPSTLRDLCQPSITTETQTKPNPVRWARKTLENSLCLTTTLTSSFKVRLLRLRTSSIWNQKGVSRVSYSASGPSPRRARVKTTKRKRKARQLWSMCSIRKVSWVASYPTSKRTNQLSRKTRTLRTSRQSLNRAWFMEVKLRLRWFKRMLF